MKRASVWVPWLLIAAAVLLGFWGWWLELGLGNPFHAAWTAGIKTVQLFFVNLDFDRPPASWQLKVAAFLAPLGLASAFVLALYRSGRAWLTGIVIRLFLKRPVLMAGSSPDALTFLKKSPPRNPLVVLSDPDALVADMGNARKRTVFLGGSPLSPRTWKRAGIAKASAVLVFPAGGEFWGIPRAIARAGAKRRRRAPLKVVVAFQDDGRQELLSGLKDSFPSRGNVEFVTRSLLHSAAADLAELIAPHTVRGGRSLFERAPHVLVEGWSPFIREFLLEAAQLYHYPAPGKTELTVVMAEGGELSSFLAEHPGLQKVVELQRLGPQELSAILGDRQPSSWKNAPSVILLAPRSPWSISTSARRWKRFQVLTGLAPLRIHALVSDSDAGEAERDAMIRGCRGMGLELHVLEDFIDWKHLVANSEVIDGIAARIHERYAALYDARPWESLTERERELNRRAARHLKLKLWCLGFRLEEGKGTEELGIPEPDAKVRDMLARLEHRRWEAEKLLEDFLSGPDSADPETNNFWKGSLRIHPDLRPFEELSAFDISKDENTFRDIGEILRLLRSTHRLVRDEAL
jgi:hypothetical protein